MDNHKKPHTPKGAGLNGVRTVRRRLTVQVAEPQVVPQVAAATQEARASRRGQPSKRVQRLLRMHIPHKRW